MIKYIMPLCVLMLFSSNGFSAELKRQRSSSPAQTKTPTPAIISENAISPRSSSNTTHSTTNLDIVKAGENPDAPHFTVHRDSLPVLKTVLKPSSVYTIDPEVIIDGYYYIFTVHTETRDYKVVSVRKLIKLCHDLNTIDHFSKTQTGSQVGKGMKSSATGIGRGVGGLFRHPGKAAKNIGSGMGRTFRGIGGLFKKKKVALTDNGKDLALYGKGFAGGERRKVAYELGLDVYAEVDTTRKFIADIAKKRLAGSLPLNIGIFALPGGTLFTLSMTPMGYDVSTEELICLKNPDALKRELAIRYKKELGLSYGEQTAPLTSLLDNPNYTPREQAYLFRYLSDMKDVKDLYKAVNFLAVVNSPEKAVIVVNQVELLSLLNARKARIAKFVPVRNTLGAIDINGNFHLVISIDTVRFWGDVKTSLQLSIQAAKKNTARSLSIWSTGDIDRKSVALANSLGVSVHQNILENPVFQAPREKKPSEK